ncbi:DUF6361 family protein [Wenzhouxiangella sp. EGI_FJ10409]|uniref:DUF6361 family protein n=1 Tax=Wenzhouxiangella sp. EGI_FJ10409 TaxID=3243767 RepID=UPI0035D82DF1
MPSTFSWLDLTASDRDKLRRVLDLFSEQGTVDELGLGSLRDAISNALFPGTSVLLTRLRYALFIPWIYQELESWGPGYDIPHHAREMEIELIGALAENEDTAGVIGISAGASLSRLASSAYWAFLDHLDLFVPDRPQSWYHRNFDALLRQRSRHPQADDPGVIWTQEPIWHPRLPAAPEDFPAAADFSLTFDEADFLQDRMLDRCKGTLLAYLAQDGGSQLAEDFWEEPVALNAPGSVPDLVELARRFSLHVEGAPLLYNLMLAQARQAVQPSQADEKRIENYRAELSGWAAREQEEDTFQTDALWAVVIRHGGVVREPQRRFVEGWSAAVSEHGAESVADLDEVRKLMRQREIGLKGPRARLANQGRLLDWSGRTGTGRMRFRWPNVRQLLIDLHRGLGA